jgi:excisionase family DNA binding protein
MRTNIAFRANRKGLNMTTETRFTKLLAATPDTVAKIDALLEGKQIETDTGDRKLLTLTDAARELNVSRMTIHRMAADGRLPTITTRAGRRRIASAALTAFLTGKAVA